MGSRTKRKIVPNSANLPIRVTNLNLSHNNNIFPNLANRVIVDPGQDVVGVVKNTCPGINSDIYTKFVC